MSAIDRSIMDQQANAFDALVQFEIPSGGQLFRLKSTDEGFLSLARTGQTHTVTINLLLTADEIDDVDPPTDNTTVSFFLRQKFLGERVQLRVVEIFVTKNNPTPTIRNEFTMDLQVIGTIRNVGGAVELPISGRILDVNPGTGQQPILDRS